MTKVRAPINERLFGLIMSNFTSPHVTANNIKTEDRGYRALDEMWGWFIADDKKSRKTSNMFGLRNSHTWHALRPYDTFRPSLFMV